MYIQRIRISICITLDQQYVSVRYTSTTALFLTTEKKTLSMDKE